MSTASKRRSPRPPWHQLPVLSFCEVVLLSLALTTVVGLVAFTIGRDQATPQVTGAATGIPSFALRED